MQNYIIIYNTKDLGRSWKKTVDAFFDFTYSIEKKVFIFKKVLNLILFLYLELINLKHSLIN